MDVKLTAQQKAQVQKLIDAALERVADEIAELVAKIPVEVAPPPADSPPAE